MATKHDLIPWVLDAIRANGGSGSAVEVARRIWAEHRDDLEASGDLFYTWQYDMRWAALILRQRGALAPKARGERVPWTLPDGGEPGGTQ